MKTFEEKLLNLREKHSLVTEKKNKINENWYNGIFDRYENCVLTNEHIPLEWRYDLNSETNPFLLERIGVNAVFNSGAIYHNGKFVLVPRIEGNDRKSYFAVCESDNGIDGFKFRKYPIRLPIFGEPDTNVYDMDDEYMFGDAFLVAPELYGTGSREVYLPEGTWLDLNTGLTYTAGAEGLTLTCDVTIAQIPVFYNVNTTSQTAADVCDDMTLIFDLINAVEIQ